MLYHRNKAEAQVHNTSLNNICTVQPEQNRRQSNSIIVVAQSPPAAKRMKIAALNDFFIWVKTSHLLTSRRKILSESL